MTIRPSTDRKNKKLPEMVGFVPPVRILHIGRKAPKGYVEDGAAIHLGRGIWILPVRPA